MNIPRVIITKPQSYANHHSFENEDGLSSFLENG